MNLNSYFVFQKSLVRPPLPSRLLSSRVVSKTSAVTPLSTCNNPNNGSNRSQPRRPMSQCRRPFRNNFTRFGTGPENRFGARFNYSIMEVISDPQSTRLRIEYVIPRPSLAKLGVKEGFVLMQGRWLDSETFAGDAKLYFPDCHRWFPIKSLAGLKMMGRLQA
jgi:hypothetical protein